MYFETMKEARDHYEGLRRKNEEIYQETGIPKYEDARIRYEMIVNAMDAWIERQEDFDYARTRRYNNIHSYIDRYCDPHGETFTKAEVKRMLLDMLNL